MQRLAQPYFGPKKKGRLTPSHDPNKKSNFEFDKKTI
jgi:hypothetical protein